MQEEKPIKIVEKVKTDLTKYANQFFTKNREHERAYYGDVWENDTQYKPVENLLFKAIETEVPILTDGLPSMTATSDDPAYKAQADNMGKAIGYVNKQQNLAVMMPVLVRQSLIGGNGWVHEFFDANAKNGDGEICREVVHWEDVMVDGACMLIEQAKKARFIVPRSRQWLMMTFPKYAKKLKEMKGKDVQEGPIDNEGRETVDIRGRGKRRRPNKYSDEDTLQLCHTYVKDYTMVTIPEEVTAEELEKEAQALMGGGAPDIKKTQNHMAHNIQHLRERGMILQPFGLPPETPFEDVAEYIGQLSEIDPNADFGPLMLTLKILDNHMEEHLVYYNENPQSKMFKFKDNWRVIKTVGKLVVSDEANEYEHGEIPLTPFYCYKDATIYGFNEIENCIDSQRMISEMTFKEHKGLLRVANPWVYANVASGLKKEDITNDDGLIFILPDDGEIKHVEPGQISPQLSQFADGRARNIEDISGNNEVSQGKMPSPNASGVTVERLQLRAIGRHRLKIRTNMHYSLARMGRLTYGNITQFWTTEKKIGIEEVDGFSQQILYNPLDMQDIEMNIEMDEDTMAGTDKEAFTGLMYAMLANQQIDLVTFLTVTDIPKKNQLLKMVDDSQQKAQIMQELQIQNLMMRYEHDPDSMTEEEAEQAEQIMVQQSGVDQDQPEQPQG